MRVAVIGAGPSGLVAAILLACRGHDVEMVDENRVPGGFLAYDLAVERATEWRVELAQAAKSAGVICTPDSVAWAVFRVKDGFEVAITDGIEERALAVDRVVIAAGTTDLAWHGPGATLPGVMTARAVQILVNRHGVIPAQRVAVIGAGSHAERISAFISSVGMELAGQFPPESVVRITGDIEVAGIQLVDGAMIATQVVVLAIGEAPDTQLAGMLEMPRIFDRSLGGWRVTSADSGDRVHVIGGALLGPALPADLIRSAISAVDGIAGSGAGTVEAGMPVTESILTIAAVQR